MDIIFIRHAKTLWNRQKRLQGRRDIAAMPQALAEWQKADLRKDIFVDCHYCYASPLQRAQATAELLCAHLDLPMRSDSRLSEMNFGIWEGQKLDDIRHRLGFIMARQEAKGLHFKAPGGETPYQVQLRLQNFLGERNDASEAIIAVTHKGVIRAAYALATGWDMLTPPADKLQSDNCAHIFHRDSKGHLHLKHLNVKLF